MPNEPENPFARLPEVQKQIRQAVEQRNYAQVLLMVEKQRVLFHEAGYGHPEILRFARIAHELTLWALTMVRLQRAHTKSAIHRLSTMKRISNSYRYSMDPAIVFGDHSISPFTTQG
jgi:hypothetical protein